MRGFLLSTVLAVLAMPHTTFAKPSPEAEVIEAADAFFAALRNPDKTALATVMLPDGVIYVHNRMDRDNPTMAIVKAEDHLANWAQDTRVVDEWMTYDSVLVDGDMAHVWGPYTFWIGDTVSHCGINSMNLVKSSEGEWKVGNTNFTVEHPDQCQRLNAPERPE